MWSPDFQRLAAITTATPPRARRWHRPNAAAGYRRCGAAANTWRGDERRQMRRRGWSSFDSPPPSTITSGSKMLTTWARPRASRSGVPVQRRHGRRLASRGLAGDRFGVNVHARCAAGDPPPCPAPTPTPPCSPRGRTSTAALDARRPAPKAGDCGPTRRRSRWARRSAGRRTRGRRRSRCRGSRRTPSAPPRRRRRPPPTSAKQLASLASAHGPAERAPPDRGRAAAR